MKKYTVITNTTMVTLIDLVNENIKIGWEPIGGISAIHSPGANDMPEHPVFMQAMVKTS